MRSQETQLGEREAGHIPLFLADYGTRAYSCLRLRESVHHLVAFTLASSLGLFPAPRTVRLGSIPRGSVASPRLAAAVFMKNPFLSGAVAPGRRKLVSRLGLFVISVAVGIVCDLNRLCESKLSGP